jgi:hypothetical protein
LQCKGERKDRKIKTEFPKTFYVQKTLASIEPRAPKIDVQMRLGGSLGTAPPENVVGGAVADDVLLPGEVVVLDGVLPLVGSAEPSNVIVVGPSSVNIEVSVLVG